MKFVTRKFNEKFLSHLSVFLLGYGAIQTLVGYKVEELIFTTMKT
jgi:hypothetical protein